jgi:hypothetical protein
MQPDFFGLLREAQSAGTETHWKAPRPCVVSALQVRNKQNCLYVGFRVVTPLVSS